MSMLVAIALGAVIQTSPASSPVAPEFVGGPWPNVVGKVLTLAGRRGKPTLVAFWTFGCSNCQANLPSYARLYARYKPKGVELVAIHTPETARERDGKAVSEHIRRFKIDYPVLIDNDGRNWNRWGLQFWPTLFVVDGAGRIRGKFEGELEYGGAGGEAKVATMLDRLLAER